MTIQDTIIPNRIDESSVDNATIGVNNSSQLEIKSEWIVDVIGNQALDIITLLSDASLGAYSYQSLVSEDFSDASGYNDYVDSANTNATFNSSKYEYQPITVYQYKFNGDATDSIGSNDGTAANLTYTTGKLNNCAVFNGTNAYVTLGNSTFGLSASNSPWGVAFWIKTTAEAGAIIVNYQNNGTNYRFSVKLTTGGYVIVEGQSGNVTSDTAVNDDAWNHVAVVFDGTNLKIHINGTEDKSSAFTNMNPTSSTQNVRIGSQTPSEQWIAASMDDFRIYPSGVITESEIASLYNSGSGTEDNVSSTPVVQLDLPSISGTVTEVAMVARDFGDQAQNITYDVYDGTSWQTGLTKGSFSSYTGSSAPTKMRIHLDPGGSPTNGNPGIFTMALLLKKSFD